MNKPTENKPARAKAKPAETMIPSPAISAFCDFPQTQVGPHSVIDTRGLSLDEVAAMMPGARIVRGPGESAVILTPEPGELEALEQVDMALEMLRALLKPMGPAALLPVDALEENLRWLLQVKGDELYKSAAKMLELQETIRKQEFSRRGKLRTSINPTARAKADAKAEAEALWNEWMDKKPKKTWRNEDFAAEALRRWPGKIASIGVVVNWIPVWKRAREQNSSQLAG